MFDLHFSFFLPPFTSGERGWEGEICVERDGERDGKRGKEMLQGDTARVGERKRGREKAREKKMEREGEKDRNIEGERQREGERE